MMFRVVIIQHFLVVDLTLDRPLKLWNHLSLPGERNLSLRHENVRELTSLHLDPLGLHRGYVKSLFGVALPNVIARSQSPQRVPRALIPPGWSHCSLVFFYS